MSQSLKNLLENKFREKISSQSCVMDATKVKGMGEVGKMQRGIEAKGNHQYLWKETKIIPVRMQRKFHT